MEEVKKRNGLDIRIADKWGKTVYLVQSEYDPRLFKLILAYLERKQGALKNEQK
jgi:hypothetical protein